MKDLTKMEFYPEGGGVSPIAWVRCEPSNPSSPMKKVTLEENVLYFAVASVVLAEKGDGTEYQWSASNAFYLPIFAICKHYGPEIYLHLYPMGEGLQGATLTKMSTIGFLTSGQVWKLTN